MLRLLVPAQTPSRKHESRARPGYLRDGRGREMDLNSQLESMKSEYIEEDVSLVRDSADTERSLSLSLISGPEMIERFSLHNQQLFTPSIHSAFHPPRFSAFNLVRTFPAPARPETQTNSNDELAEVETNKRKSSVKNSGSCKKTKEKCKQTEPAEAAGEQNIMITVKISLIVHSLVKLCNFACKLIPSPVPRRCTKWLLSLFCNSLTVRLVCLIVSVIQANRESPVRCAATPRSRTFTTGGCAATPARPSSGESSTHTR